MKHTLLAVVVVAAALGAGCGKNPAGPSPFNQTINGNLTSFAYTSHAITASRGGTMTVTLTWTAGADRDLDLYLTDNTCQDIYGLTPCALLAESIAVVGTSEMISRTVQQGEAYKIWVDSFSTSSHSYTLQITIQ